MLTKCGRKWLPGLASNAINLAAMQKTANSSCSGHCARARWSTTGNRSPSWRNGPTDTGQSDSHATMATNLGESRKYKLYLTLISPYIGKFPHAKVLEKLDNNAGLKIGGRQSSNSKGAVANEKLMGISSASLDRLQTGKFYVKALSNPAFRIKNSSHLVGNQHAMSDGSWLKIIQQQIEAYYRPVQTPEEAHGRIPGSCLDMGLHSRLHGKRRKFSDPECSR